LAYRAILMHHAAIMAFLGEQRIKSVENWDEIKTVRYYLGDYEVTIVDEGVPMELIYVSAPGLGIVAILETHNNGEDPKIHVTYTDHLGTITKVTNELGVIVAEQAFDPWGRRRDPKDWSIISDQSLPSWLYRGFTGHEMLENFDVIHMNGRLYDPILARMLSPDNYVQNPNDPRSFNRYAYVLNNPLKYSDPTGEYFFIIPMISWSAGGGLNISVTAGVGLPGGASAQVTVGHNFKSSNTYISAGVTVAGVTASVGWGTQTGYTASVGVGMGIPGLNGFSSNLTGGGISWSQNGGTSTQAFGFNMDSQGNLTFDPRIGYSKRFNIEKGMDKSTPNYSPSGNEMADFNRVLGALSHNYAGMNGIGGGDSYDPPAYAVQGPTFVFEFQKSTKVVTTFWTPTPQGVSGSFTKRQSGSDQSGGGNLSSGNGWGYDPAVAAVIGTPTNVVNTSATWAIADGATDIAKFGKIISRTANGLSYATAAYQFATGNDNTSTWVDVGITTAGIITVGIVGTAGAPFVAAGALVYGIWSFAGGSDWIDNNWGYRD
jgi:RHS repeat-associated protein